MYSEKLEVLFSTLKFSYSHAAEKNNFVFKVKNASFMKVQYESDFILAFDWLHNWF